MLQKFQSLEKKIDDLDSKTTNIQTLEKKIDFLASKTMETPGKLMEQYDLTVYNQSHMFQKLSGKVDRHEALLMRVVGFGQTLRDITYLQTEIANDVKLIREEGETNNCDEDAQYDTEDEVVAGAGPVETTASVPLPSVPTFLGPDDMVPGPVEKTVGPTIEETSAIPFVPTSPDVTMTTATPLNSQDDIQHTTTLLTSTGGQALPPTSDDPVQVETSPTAETAPVHSPPPTKPVTEEEPPKTVHLSPPATVEEEIAKGNRKRQRTPNPNIGDRRSPRLKGNSRAPSPAVRTKRPAEDDEGGNTKRVKVKPS
jgi:hypothetical protein